MRVLRARSHRPELRARTLGKRMSGGVNPRGSHTADRNATQPLTDQARLQKGENPSSTLSFLCSGLSRSGAAGIGHGGADRRRRIEHDEMSHATEHESKTRFQRTGTNDWKRGFSLSPIGPKTEWGAVGSERRFAVEKPSTSLIDLGFICFDSNCLLLLLLLPCYHNTTTRFVLTSLVLSSHHGFQYSNREVSAL